MEESKEIIRKLNDLNKIKHIVLFSFFVKIG